MSGRRWIVGAGAALGIGVMSLAVAVMVLLARSPQPPGTVVLEKDVVYCTVEGKPLKLDIARPKAGEGPFPAILCIHGGGWRAGDKSEYLQAIFELSQQGYVAATVQYRFAPKFPFPAQIHDVKAAVRYLRGHARRLRIDPDRIGVMGASAGGHLAPPARDDRPG